MKHWLARVTLSIVSAGWGCVRQSPFTSKIRLPALPAVRLSVWGQASSVVGESWARNCGVVLTEPLTSVNSVFLEVLGVLNRMVDPHPRVPTAETGKTGKGRKENEGHVWQGKIWLVRSHVIYLVLSRGGERTLTYETCLGAWPYDSHLRKVRSQGNAWVW